MLPVTYNFRKNFSPSPLHEARKSNNRTSASLPAFFCVYPVGTFFCVNSDHESGEGKKLIRNNALREIFRKKLVRMSPDV